MGDPGSNQLRGAVIVKSMSGGKCTPRSEMVLNFNNPHTHACDRKMRGSETDRNTTSRLGLATKCEIQAAVPLLVLGDLHRIR